MPLNLFTQIEGLVREIDIARAKSNQSYHLFLSHVKHDIEKLNTLIASYNIASNAENVAILSSIHEFYQEISNKYNTNYLHEFSPFRHQFIQFYQQLQNESKRIRPSHDGVFSVDREKTTHSAILELGEIIASMSAEDTSKLLDILLQSPFRTALNSFIHENPKLTVFFQKNLISFLGGNNSKNFLITPNDGSQAFVFSAFNLFSRPQSAAHKIQRLSSLEHTINPCFFEKKAISSAKSSIYSLKITEYCPAKDLHTLSPLSADKPLNVEKQLRRGLLLFTQMSYFLAELQKHNLAFTDMKNANWLAMTNGQLRLSDLKAIYHTNERHQIAAELNFLQGYSPFAIIHTKGYLTPEMMSFLKQEISSFSADLMHAKLFALNLKTFLVGAKNTNRLLYHIDPIGKELFQLIDSIQSSTDAAISMEEIHHKLNEFLLAYIDNKIAEINHLIPNLPFLVSLRQSCSNPLAMSEIQQVFNLFETIDTLKIAFDTIAEIKAAPFNKKNSPFNLYFKSFKDKLENCDSLVLYQETHDEIMRFNQLISEANTLLSTLKLDFSFSDEDTAMNTYIEGMHQRFIEAGSLQEIESIIAEINADIQNLNSSRFNEVKTAFLEMKAEKKLPEQLESIENILKRLPLKERMLPLSDRAWHNAKMAISAYNRSLSSQTMFKPTQGSVAEPTPKQGPTHD